MSKPRSERGLLKIERLTNMIPLSDNLCQASTDELDTILREACDAVDRAARRLTTLLWRGAPWAYLWRPTPNNPTRHGESFWFRTGELTPTPPAGWRDVYFGVNPCSVAGSAGERTGDGAWRVGAVNCLFADFDAKMFTGGYDELLTHVHNLELSPSAIVATGGGVHAYWVFEKPVYPPFSQVADWQRLWVDQVVKADRAAKDLGRVLRLPGSFNHKYDPPRAVTILDGDPVDRLYPTEVIAEVLQPYIRLESEKRAVEAERARDAVKVEASWNRLFEWAKQDATEGNRHRTAMRLAYRLKDAGAPESLALALVTDIMQDNPDRESAAIVKAAYR